MVEKPELPQPYADKFRENLDILLPPDDPLRQRLQQAPLMGIPIALLELPGVEKFDLDEARDAGWLVMAMADGVLYGGEILDGKDGLEMGGLWRDPALPALLKELNERTGLNQLKSEGTLRVKLLSIPAVLTDALWIYSGTEQYIVPIRVQDKLLPVNDRFRAAGFLQQLAEAAKAFRGFDTADEPSSTN